MFPLHSVLESRTLEAVVFRWDGTHGQALKIADELRRELQMRDAELTEARFHARYGSEPSDRLFLTVVRKSDGRDWEANLWPKQWAVFYLHEYRLSTVDVLTEHKGDALFRPVRPIVRLSPIGS